MQADQNAQGQVGKKRKVAKKEENFTAGQEPQVRQPIGSAKAELQTTDPSGSNQKLQAVRKERLQEERDIRQPQVLGQDPKSRRLPNGTPAEKEVKPENRPRMPKSSNPNKLYKNSAQKQPKKEDHPGMLKSPHSNRLQKYSEIDSKKWSAADEMVLLRLFLRDLKLYGTFPPKQGGNYWDELARRLRGGLEVDWNKSQIYNKYRRMKSRYAVLAQRMQSSDSKLRKCKDLGEQKLYKLFQKLWDPKIQDQEPPSPKPSWIPSEHIGPHHEDVNGCKEEEEHHAGGKKPYGESQVDSVKNKSMPPGTFEALTLIEKVQRNFTKLLEEDYSKVNNLVEKYLKESNEKIEWLLKVGLGSALLGAGVFSPISGQFSDSIDPLGIFNLESGGSVPLLRQRWLDQQSQESNVLRNKLQLLQRFLDLKEEQWKAKLIMNQVS